MKHVFDDSVDALSYGMHNLKFVDEVQQSKSRSKRFTSCPPKFMLTTSEIMIAMDFKTIELRVLASPEILVQKMRKKLHTQLMESLQRMYQIGEHQDDVHLSMPTRENSMSRITSGPLRGLQVGDTAYNFVSGEVKVIDLNSGKYRGRPIRVKSVTDGKAASFQTNGVKRSSDSHQSLFLTQNEMLMARDGHLGNATSIKEEVVMPRKRFETVSRINGEEIGNMSDDQIVSAIANMESEVETLGKVKNKPARLNRQIKAIRDDITSIVEYLDANDDEAPADTASA